jgi:hypothetical protein
MKTAISPWHDTLSQALNAGISEMQSRGAVLLNEQELREGFAFGGMRYNETKMGHAPLESYANKPTKKYAHVTIYRAESGRYEVTAYVL